MKYQQLTHLESGWKWQYLMKKYREGECITRYVEQTAVDEVMIKLIAATHDPEKIESWIIQNMNPALQIKLQQTIRARRKRHFNAEQLITRKKSIDLEFIVWQRLSKLAQQRRCTLSETITQLIEEADAKAHYMRHLQSLKAQIVKSL